MQPDSRFYGRYFAEVYLYLYQYEIQRPWRGLVILQSRQQGLGSDVPYGDLASGRVQLLFFTRFAGPDRSAACSGPAAVNRAA